PLDVAGENRGETSAQDGTRLARGGEENRRNGPVKPLCNQSICGERLIARIWPLSGLEATGGFEPPSRGFADLRLNHLATSPCRGPLRVPDGTGLPPSVYQMPAWPIK